MTDSSRRKTRAIPNGELSAASAALERRAWAEARDRYQGALQSRETPEAWEGLSWAARLLNDGDTLFPARENAFRLYRRKGDDRSAARMAMWLAADYADFRGELAVANGWRQRARRLLQPIPLCEEHAWAALIEGDAALLYESDTATAKRCAQEAVAIGADIGQSDFTTLALALEGLALVYECEFEDGIRMLDEAAVAALGEGRQHPLWVSWVLCYLLFACELARDFGRAREWCRKAADYAERFDIASGQAICRLHYASVLVWRGEWSAAEAQLSEAAALLQPSLPWFGEAMVRLGELRRRQGRVQEAEEIFTQVEWHPLALFGRAELALDAGRPREAVELVERALRQTPEGNRHQQAIALELLVRGRSLIGHHAGARDALTELEGISGLAASPPLRAAARVSAAVLATESGEYETAVAHLEDALALFGRGGAPYEVARTRLELASALVELGRLDRAAAEASQARDSLEQLGSRLQARRAAVLLEGITRRAAGLRGASRQERVLTPRQAEVLQLIARGSSDREIAGALGLSEHTVHRHVANILTRLEMPTRAAAAAHAATRGLI